MSHLRAWGCDALVRVADPKKHCQFREDQFTLDRISPNVYVPAAKTSSTTTFKTNADSDISSLSHRITRYFDRVKVRGNLHNTFGSNINDDGDNSDSDSSGGENDIDEDMVDARTMKKIRSANERQVGKEADTNTRRSKRDRQSTRQTGLNPDDFAQFALSAEIEPAHKTTIIHVSPASNHVHKQIRQSDVEIPVTRRAAMRSPFAAEWSAAMDSEMASIRLHGAFTLTTRPRDV